MIYLSFIVILVYHSVNIITDVKYRKTKNIWHLIFIIIGCVQYLFNSLVLRNNMFQFLNLTIACGVVLFMGIVLEELKYSSPGDTKMSIVTLVLLISVSPLSIFYTTFIFIFCNILFSFIFTTFLVFEKIGILNMLKNTKNLIIATFSPGMRRKDFNITISTNIPGACIFALSSLAFYILDIINIVYTN